eukprot:CAMPEP_0119419326 /NCGR_PEP_ID=MMETSP1335-20130426/20512_1 /TAXON_ID=259385 /ORGANISM="Chrysoculter rhomboideus, Strain RCC1486" /LENGTH=145 /DNA_ID=CAMNT_0007444625 /DNA_START=299 /DNA_END=733 /DNA_ORIENTATION=+
MLAQPAGRQGALGRSVVEEAHPRVRHHHAVLVRRRGDALVLHRAAWVHEVLDAVPRGHVDVVAEGEEGVGRDAHALQVLLQEGLLVLLRERLDLRAEVGFPLGELRSGEIALDVLHARIDPVLPLHALLERQREHLGVLAQRPRL